VEVFASGDDGTVMHFDTAQNRWTRLTRQGGGADVHDRLFGAWGASPQAVFVTGDFGTILRASRSGYTKEDTGVSEPLRAVWGRSGGEIYATGVAGILLHSNGSGWNCIPDCDTSNKKVPRPPPQVFRDIWGAVDRDAIYLVGWDGVILDVDSPRSGATFQSHNCVTASRLEGVYATYAPFAGDGGVPDGAIISDGGVPLVPAAWIVGASGTLLTGP
jgi:hypothetical protein